MAASVALLVSAILLLPSGQPKIPPFSLLKAWPHEKLSFRDHIDRLLPRQRSWAWAWRTEEFFFGKRKVVNISASVLSFNGDAVEKCAAEIGPPAFSITNQVNVWLLSTNQIKAFRKAVERSAGSRFLNNARVSTADGIQAEIFCGDSRGTNPVVSAGLEMDFLAHRRPAHVDLIVGALYSEFQTNAGPETAPSAIVVRTNLNTLFRIQLPSGKGLLILDNDRTNTNRFGVTVNPI
jgi:hypothetical protein